MNRMPGTSEQNQWSSISLRVTFPGMIRQFCTAAAFATFISVGNVSAQAIIPSFFDYESILGGTVVEFAWSELSSTDRPGYPATVSGTFANWPALIQPNGGNPNLLLGPTAGFESDATDFLPNSNGGGIYTFFSRTHFSITSSASSDGLRSLIFQISMADGIDTGSLNVVGTPTLSLTTTTGAFVIPATYSQLLSTTQVTVNGFDTSLNLLAYQWDLSGIAGQIQGYSLDWQVAQHAINYGFSITESTAVQTEDILAVPEPASVALFLSGFVIATALHVRRRTLR
jgi:PEP-CTERM putative exosortase interaction domain